MKRSVVILVIMCTMFCHQAIATIVSFDLTDLGNGSFEYIYTIENDTLSIPIEQITVWFDEQLYVNLQVTTQVPLANDWSEITLPSTGFGIPFGYDALALAGGIALGQSVEGFSVSFDWLGTGLPGSQQFEIINPVDSQMITTGITIPEPATVLIFGFGTLLLKKKHGK